MQRYTGILGILLILGIAFIFSNNKKRINLRLVLSGLGLQILIAVLVLKVPFVINAFKTLGAGMHKLEEFAKYGADFVFGGMMVQTKDGAAAYSSVPGAFLFAINISATIILVCLLIAVFYYLGIMQRIISVIARAMNVVMRVSGAEALSNVASAFVGQVEAQILIKPYLSTMTRSELLASMAGSLACISGGIMVVYVSMGVHAEYLITASIMAMPGALVISKIIFPETEISPTYGHVKLQVKTEHANLIDAITYGISDGLKIAVSVVAMLIGFMAFIALINWGLGHIYHGFSIEWVFSKIFYPFAWAIGVPQQDVNNAASLLGEKLTINEFVAFKDMTSTKLPMVTNKGLVIISVALCGFANFASVGMQIGGIGTMAPERRKDLAKLGLKALLCGTLASYLSAAIAGLLI